MERRVIIEGNERVTPEDFNNFGKFPQNALDHVVHDLGLDDAGFYGFTTAGDSGASRVTVGAGRLYIGNADGTAVFYNDDEGGTEVVLLNTLPVVTRKIVTIAAYGREVPTNSEPRTFLTDAVSRATIARPTATEMRRRAEIGFYPGEERPDPVRVGLPVGVVPLAYVLLAPTGVVSITPANEARVPSIRANSAALAENAIWRAQTGTRIDTLGTDIAALAQGLKGLASDIFVREIAGDVAVLRERVQLPAAYTSYDADSFLTAAKSQLNHVDMLSTVMEGIRFPPANQGDQQIGLLNSLDSKVTVQSFFALPAYDEVPRLSLLVNEGEVAISQYEHQTQQIVQRTRTVTRTRYGTPFTVCTNQADWWIGATADYWNNTIYQGGATYNIINTIGMGGPEHTLFRLERVWTDVTTEPYWDFNTVTDTAAGSILSQTFLNSQDGWLTSVGLLLTKVAAAGDIQVLITECVNGEPDLTKVVGRATATVATLKSAPTVTKVGIAPVLLKKGIRYALVLITAGNHFIGIMNDNKFAQGSLFYSSDGAFQFGDLTRDMCFQLNFAKFRSPYTEVQIQPIQLAGGIAAIDTQYPSAMPNGTQLVMAVQDPANGNWIPLNEASDGRGLIGLPPLVQAKFIMIGTTDLMPGFGVGADARIRPSRPRPDFRHISTIRTLPAPCKNFSIKIRLEAWRGAAQGHSHVLKVLTGPLLTTGVGDTVVTASSFTDAVDPQDPQAIVRTYTFSVATAVSSFRMRHEGTVGNVLTTFHVAKRIDIETP